MTDMMDNLKTELYSFGDRITLTNEANGDKAEVFVIKDTEDKLIFKYLETGQTIVMKKIIKQ